MKPRRKLNDSQLEKASESLSKCLYIAGSVKALAADLGVTVGQVYKFVKRGYVSATCARTLGESEKYPEINKEDLCPDVKIWF